MNKDLLHFTFLLSILALKIECLIKKPQYDSKCVNQCHKKNRGSWSIIGGCVSDCLGTNYGRNVQGSDVFSMEPKDTHDAYRRIFRRGRKLLVFGAAGEASLEKRFGKKRGRWWKRQKHVRPTTIASTSTLLSTTATTSTTTMVTESFLDSILQLVLGTGSTPATTTDAAYDTTSSWLSTPDYSATLKESIVDTTPSVTLTLQPTTERSIRKPQYDSKCVNQCHKKNRGSWSIIEGCVSDCLGCSDTIPMQLSATEKQSVHERCHDACLNKKLHLKKKCWKNCSRQCGAEIEKPSVETTSIITKTARTTQTTTTKKESSIPGGLHGITERVSAACTALCSTVGHCDKAEDLDKLFEEECAQWLRIYCNAPECKENCAKLHSCQPSSLPEKKRRLKKLPRNCRECIYTKCGGDARFESSCDYHSIIGACKDDCEDVNSCDYCSECGSI